MQDARIKIAIALFGLIILVGCGATLYSAKKSSAPPPIVITPAPAQSAPIQVVPIPDATDSFHPPARRPAPQKLYVHVAGAVMHPWLYALAPGSRVLQAIMAAGGPAPHADIDAINLAEKVQDGEKVYVPTVQMAKSLDISPAPPGNAIGLHSIMPSPATSDNSLPTVLEPASVTSPSANSPHHRSSRISNKITSPAEGVININTADANQLMRLPDVGPAMAARILAYRAQAQGFQSISQLQQVKGIGPKKFAKISPLVALNGP